MYFKNNHQDVEDAVSVIFLKYMEHGDDFADEQHEKAWLIVSAQNYCKSNLKHWWKKKRLDVDDSQISQQSESFEISETMEAILELPEKLRNAIYLHYYEGYTIEEISEMYYVSASTVYN